MHFLRLFAVIAASMTAAYFPVLKGFLRAPAFAANTSNVTYTIGLAGVLQLMRSGDTLLVDTRNEAAYATAHIGGSLNLPIGTLDQIPATVLRRLQNASTVVVYCSGTGCADSGTAARNLTKQNIGRIAVYKEGMAEWLAAGLPTEGPNAK